MRQIVIRDKFDKENRERVHQYVAKWFYEASISFNAINRRSFKVMVEAIGQYGPGYLPPSDYALGERLLRKEVESVKKDLLPHRESWENHGCSVMIYTWTDRRGRSIMNLVVHCRRGISFLRSIDALAETHDGQFIFELVDKTVEEVGERNVIQVVTDNAANKIAASKFLKVKYPHIFWTPCAAHSIDLMLEDIGKQFKEDSVIKKAKAVCTFIYSHVKVLSLLRKKTNKKDLVKAGVTRFATSYLCLQRMFELRDKLREMFTSDEWTRSRWYTKRAGRKTQNTILSSRFFNEVIYALKVFQPLVKVLRLVDSGRPCMGLIYAAIENAKKEIIQSFEGDEKQYKEVVDIIKKRWAKSPLHAAGYHLNATYYYNNREEIRKQSWIMHGLIECISKFYNQNIQDLIVDELELFMNEKKSFGTPMAVRQRSRPNPVTWWELHGGDAPHLQAMAIKILGLTCSSSGCERNWSTFEMIHTKKRNRLEQKKLNALVFVQFNMRLLTPNSKPTDAIASRKMNSVIEWLVDPADEEVFPGEGDGLTWVVVDDAAEATTQSGPRRSTRSVAQLFREIDEQNVESMEMEEDDEEELNNGSDEEERDFRNEALDLEDDVDD